MLKEFREFAMKGNVLDMAVGVIIGAAFSKIIDSVVTNILTPLIGLVLGRVDFKGLAVTVGSSRITYGLFLNALLDFLIVAFALFLFIKQVNRFKREPAAAAAGDETRDCPFCASSISTKATRCPNCTSDLSSQAVVAESAALPSTS